jgi:hypothetical protein
MRRRELMMENVERKRSLKTALCMGLIRLFRPHPSPSSSEALERIQGDARPKALGGDRRSGRIEARAGLILALVEEKPDITLEELRAALARRGLAVGYGTLWRFFARRRITRKKRPHTRPSRTGRTS